MPWKENSVLDLRIQFIALYLQDVMSVAELCRHFGISRTTGYKFIERYKIYGPAGLEDQPKAPFSHPNATDQETQSKIIALRTQHPNWGAKKLKTVLMCNYPERVWPASSTIGEILKYNNLLKSRRTRRSAAHTLASDLSAPNAANAVWTADFKGQFRLGNNQMCYPLTVCDRYSRMILRCQALASTSFDQAKPVWVAAFREYGLPAVIRTDNGTPFASTGISGISRLSAWWIRLGIIPERIQPGKPQQNGSHERMHRTLKQEVASRPKAHLKAQQLAFNHFVHEYNYIRPHEALGQQVPASFYTSSARQYPLILPEPEYPSTFAIRRVRSNGEIRWHNTLIFLSEVLVGELVALDQLDDRHLVLYYSQFPLAILDGQSKSWLSAKQAAPLLKQLRKELQQNTLKC